MPINRSRYKLISNGQVFSFSTEDAERFDIVKKSPGTFHLIEEHHSTTGRLLETDMFQKKITLEIEGEIFEVEIKDELDQMLDKMGYGMGAGKQVKEIKAPMPGLILEIAVSEGQEVAEGDKILILEAMKMENCLKILGQARSKKITVSPGQAVEKGQVLVELE